MSIHIQLNAAAQLKLSSLVEALPFSKAKDELQGWLKLMRFLREDPPEPVGQDCECVRDYFNKRSNWFKSQQFLVRWAIDIVTDIAKFHETGKVMPGLSEKHVMIHTDNHALVIPPTLSSQEAKMEWTPANDMFNFGLILFGIATECKYDLFERDWRYFIHSDDQDKFAQDEKVAQACLERLNTSWIHIPATLHRIIAQCLHENKEKRPTASGVLWALEKMQNGESETSDFR